MKNVNSYQIAHNLYLNSALVSSGAPPRNVPVNVNHIAVVDCSGSMYGELDKLRAGLKAKLPTLMREGDTLSLIWFSGRGQFGPILEAESVASLRDLAKVNKAIDRWLQPQGLTGFKEPLDETAKMITRIQKLNSNPFALFFMSDGMDNQWPRAEVLKTIETVAKGLVSSTFVEYGNYADRQMLSAMAERAGGQLVHCDSFGKFEPTFVQAVTKQVGGAKRVSVEVPKTALGDIVFEMVAPQAPRDRARELHELITYDATSGNALVSENTEQIWWLSSTQAGMAGIHDERPALYAAMSLFAVRMKPEIVFPLLKASGDVRFIKMFANCFGKQAYSMFMDATKAAAFYPSLRRIEGYNPNLVPADDAFTVLDLLKLLSEDDNTRLMLDDPSFEYSKISRATVNVDGDDALKFEPEVAFDGYGISSLTFNEESPNISVLIKKEGKVDLSARIVDFAKQVPKAPTRLPIDAFPSFIYRNYAIIAHGIVNVQTLPVDISKDVYRKLVAAGVKLTDNERGITCIDLTTLPIINRKMVKSVALIDAAHLAWSLQTARAAQKVYKDYVKNKYPNEKLAGYSALYGDAGAAWLKEQGLTEYSGFNPPRVQAESVDFIMGKELTFKIKGYSSLPPVEKVKDKMKAKGKLNGPEKLMEAAILIVEEFLAINPAKLHHDWLVGMEKMNQAVVRSLSYQLSQIVFSIIVGQTWFSDRPTLDDKTITIKTHDDEDVIVTAEMREIEIKL